MNMQIIDSLKITKKKIFVTLMFPVVAVLILLSFFTFDEFLGLSGTSIVNAGYGLGNYIYLFIFLPLNFVDSDVTPSIIFKTAVILTPIWWYLLSCGLISLLGKRQKK